MRVERRLLLRWWFVASVAVLALNDHVLKDAFPGWWTGKVSDVVGPIVVATILTVLVGRTPAVALTVAGFFALKTIPGMAETAAPLLGGTTRRDPTDLIGLLALVPVWRWMAPTSQPHPAAARRAAERRAAMASAAVALLAATATSSVEPPMVVDLQAKDGSVYAEVGNPDRWARSDDGGRTWTESKRPRRVEVGGAAREDEACSASGRCVRLTEHSVEERDDDGEWQTGFAYSDDDLALMDYREWIEPSLNDVVILEADGDETVVVSTGADGVVVSRAPGDWERVAVLEVEPTDLSGTMLFLDLLPWAFLAAVLGLVAVLVDCAARSSASSRKVSGGTYLLAVVMWVLGVGAAFFAWAFGVFAGAGPVTVAFVVALILCAAVLLPWWCLSSGRRAGRWNITP
jgi:hypothetical protein